jgi:tetratricopeptide (TPR) repeat protein
MKKLSLAFLILIPALCNICFAEPVSWDKKISELRTLQQKRQYQPAIEAGLEALEIAKENYGYESKKSAITLARIAYVYSHKRNHKMAAEYNRKALKIAEKIFRAEEYSLSRYHRSLGLNYSNLKKYNLAEKHLKKALQITETTKGKEHINTAGLLIILGSIKRIQKEFILSERYLKKALEIRKNNLGSEHNYIAETLNSLASLYIAQEKYQLAEKMYRQSLQITEKLAGPEHYRTTSSLTQLARILIKTKKFREAETLTQRAIQNINQQPASSRSKTQRQLKKLQQNLEIIQAALNNNLNSGQSPDLPENEKEKWTGMILDYSKHINDKNFFNALVIAQEIVKYSEIKFGRNKNTCYAYTQLANCHIFLQQPDSALVYFIRAYDLSRQIYGNSSETITALENVSKTYKIQTNYPQSLKYYQAALTLREKLSGKNHPSVIIGRRDLENLKIQSANPVIQNMDTGKQINRDKIKDPRTETGKEGNTHSQEKKQNDEQIKKKILLLSVLILLFIISVLILLSKSKNNDLNKNRKDWEK